MLPPSCGGVAVTIERALGRPLGGIPPADPRAAEIRLNASRTHVRSRRPVAPVSACAGPRTVSRCRPTPIDRLGHRLHPAAGQLLEAVVVAHGASAGPSPRRCRSLRRAIGTAGQPDDVALPVVSPRPGPAGRCRASRLMRAVGRLRRDRVGHRSLGVHLRRDVSPPTGLTGKRPRRWSGHRQHGPPSGCDTPSRSRLVVIEQTAISPGRPGTASAPGDGWHGPPVRTTHRRRPGDPDPWPKGGSPTVKAAPIPAVDHDA